MKTTAEPFRTSDVTRWGVIALTSVALAVVSANVSALIPSSLLSGLHATHPGGLSVGELRDRVSQLGAETAALRRETGELAGRFSVGEEARIEAARRIGALEVSLPYLLEAIVANPGIDRTTTASTGAPRGDLLEVDGGTMRVVDEPYTPPVPMDQSMPALAETPPSNIGETRQFGVAIGPGVSIDEAASTWDTLARVLGPTVFGLTPLLADESDGGKRIVLGPTQDLAEATALCSRIERAAVSCQPMPYTGTPLAP